MQSEPSSRLVPILRRVLPGIAAAYILVYLAVALLRLRYPFQLEWIESGSLDQVRRILSGRKLYARPSLGFVSFIYTPVYFYVSAAAARVLGDGFLPLRLVSLAASLGCMGLPSRWCAVRRAMASQGCSPPVCSQPRSGCAAPGSTSAGSTRSSFSSCCRPSR